MLVSEKKVALTESRGAAKLLKSILAKMDKFDQDKEHFFTILLNGRNVSQKTYLVSTGTLTACTVHPREIFRLAIAHSAGSIIIGHNHPSGDVAPSKEDLDLTERFVEAGKLLGIQVLDHIIFGGDGYISLFGGKGSTEGRS